MQISAGEREKIKFLRAGMHGAVFPRTSMQDPVFHDADVHNRAVQRSGGFFGVLQKLFADAFASISGQYRKIV